MLKMKIPVVMVSDENYISQTRVAIWTMCENLCKDSFLEITILCSALLDKICRRRLIELEKIWLNLRIKFYEVNSEIFKNAQVVAYVPVSSFYRFIIPEVLKDNEKCLFLDGDIIVNTDLKNLYLQDIEDNYLAGVRDSDFIYNPDGAISHCNQYGFDNFNTYVNAGVLIFNLAKMREDRLQSRFLKSMETYYPYMDQDILNKVCDGKIKLLDMKYNLFNRCKNKKVKKALPDKQSGNNEREWEILHFAGADKPWINFRVRGAQEWWACAKRALEESVYNDMNCYVQSQVIQNDWSYILERCRKEKTIVVIGYSHIGIDVFTSLKRGNVMADMFFCDNSEMKQKIFDDTVTIYPVEEMAKKHLNALWINTSQRRFTEINIQLKDLGIREEQILVYRHKGELYFDMLDDLYIEYELNQMKLKNLGSLN